MRLSMPALLATLPRSFLAFWVVKGIPSSVSNSFWVAADLFRRRGSRLFVEASCDDSEVDIEVCYD